MKRILLLALALPLVFALVSCTSSNLNLLSDPAMTGLSGKYSKVFIKMESIDDFGTIYLNGEKVLYVEYEGRPRSSDWVDVTGKLNSGANTLRFTLESPWQPGFGRFLVKADDDVLFSYYKTRTRVEGVIYDETITLNW